MSEFEQFPYEMEQQRVVPANEPGRGVCLTGMILGISACVFALFTFMMIIIFGIAADSGSTYYYRTMIMSITPMNIMLSMVSLGLSIPALILGIKGSRATLSPNRTFGKVGKITGLIGVIAASVCMVFAMALCATAL